MYIIDVILIIIIVIVIKMYLGHEVLPQPDALEPLPRRLDPLLVKALPHVLIRRDEVLCAIKNQNVTELHVSTSFSTQERAAMLIVSKGSMDGCMVVTDMCPQKKCPQSHVPLYCSMTRTDLHLFELARPEDEVARRDLVTEGLAHLTDPERHLDTACRLHVLLHTTNKATGRQETGVVRSSDGFTIHSFGPKPTILQ